MAGQRPWIRSALSSVLRGNGAAGQRDDPVVLRVCSESPEMLGVSEDLGFVSCLAEWVVQHFGGLSSLWRP